MANHSHSHHNGDGANPQRSTLVREIEQMEEVLAKRMYRGLLKTLTRVWKPSESRIRRSNRRCYRTQAAERGLRRLDAALDRIGGEALYPILQSLQLTSLDQVDNLETLRKVVLAAEQAAGISR